MRVMVIIKASKESETGRLPSEQDLRRMSAFNDQLAAAGIMLAGEGLKASSNGARIRFDKSGKKTVIDGPFAETKELVGGFWVWQVKSKEEAIEWLKRAPFNNGEEVEIRPLFEVTDFEGNVSQEDIEAEQEQRRKSGYAERPTSS